ncbi:PPP1R13L isoform 4, partial [Pongo abelii]
ETDWWWAALHGQEGYVPRNYFGIPSKVLPMPTPAVISPSKPATCPAGPGMGHHTTGYSWESPLTPSLPAVLGSRWETLVSTRIPAPPLPN